MSEIFHHLSVKLSLKVNILRHFDVLPNFAFTTSEMNCDY